MLSSVKEFFLSETLNSWFHWQVSQNFRNVAHVWIRFLASYAMLPCTLMLCVRDMRSSALLSTEAHRRRAVGAAWSICEYCPKVSGEPLGKRG